jgi:hypothetical protein
MTYKPLTMRPPRLERPHKAKEYEAKGAECDQLAGLAYTPGEKQAWIELRDDWVELAKEAQELSLWVEAANVPLADCRPRDERSGLDLEPGVQPVQTDDMARGETLGES